MFRFEHIEFLYGLMLVPVFILLFFYGLKLSKQTRKKLVDQKLFNRLLPGWSGTHQWLRFSLIIIILILLVLAISNPQWATRREKVKTMSTDVFIALDISKSMRVQDIPPNRLERAKKLAENLIISLKGNRIGLIFFAGEAYIQMPLTADYAAALMFLKSANPGQIESQGTAIVEAIEIANQSFLEDHEHQRAMVIITDGEDHQGEAIEKAREANDNGMSIFTYGIGTPEGDFIPYINNMGVQSYIKDKDGNFIKSKVNIELLDGIASAGGGKYYSVLSGKESVEDLVENLEKLEKREMEQRSFTAYDSYYQYFLLLAIILLVIEFLLPERALFRIKNIG